MSLPDGIADDTAVAVVGMAGRFPGARDLGQFWENLRQGVHSVRFLSEEQLRERGVPERDRRDPRFVPAVAELEGHDQFDAPFFGVSPREAELLDPQHRIFLEVAWEALEDAACEPELHRGRIAVFAGATTSTYLLSNLMRSAELLASVDPLQLIVGNAADSLATRVSYKLNLRGPSLTVQSACSTSLVAVHLACRSLLSGECDMALAGGVSVNVSQRAGYRHEEGSISSPDGYCRAFDARGQGTIFGSGAGVVALKRLEDALADGDAIRAILRGSAVNNDGSGKVGYTAPSALGQARVIAEALAAAGASAADLSYVEAHGTGTDLGDPIEIEGLTKAFAAFTKRKRFCPIGTVKTNVGHLDIASGVAGLIKTILALEHRAIPPSLHFERPNPKIDFENSPVYVNTRLAEWTAGEGARLAGVSSFGFGGTNAHVIVQEAPPLAPTAATSAGVLLPISARSPGALEAAAARLAGHLRRHPELSLADAAYTLQVGRRSFEHRRAIVCRDRAQAIAMLETPAGAGVELAAGGPGPESSLAALGRKWLGGALPDWKELHAKDRRRRLSLPTYPFEGKRYWVDPSVVEGGGARAERSERSGPAAGEVERLGPDEWFSVPSWRLTAPLSPAAPAGDWIVFLDGLGFGRSLAEQLARAGCSATTVQAGAAQPEGAGRAELRAGADGWTIDPSLPEHWDRLLAETSSSRSEVVHLVYLWGLTEAAPEVGAPETAALAGLHQLARALARLARPEAFRLAVVCRGAAQVVYSEAMAPFQAALAGLARVIASERGSTQCRCVDLWPLDDGPARAPLLGALLAELLPRAAGAPEPEGLVALRGDQRWVPGVEPLRLPALDDAAAAAVGGRHLVVGGREGIAPAIARELAAAGLAVTAVEVGQDEDLGQALDAGAPAEGLQGLVYVPSTLQHSSFGALDDLAPPELARRLADAQRDLEALAAFAERRAISRVTVVSALAALLGGFGTGLATCTGRMVDAFVRGRRAAGDGRWSALATGPWRLGPASERLLAASPTAAALSVTPAEACAAILRLAAAERGGLTLLAPSPLAPFLSAGPERAAPVSAAPGAPPGRHPRPALRNAYVSPRGEMEQLLAELWQEALAVESVGAEDSFFELGGDSFIAIRLMSKLSARLETEVPTSSLYECLTIRALACQLGRGDGSEGPALAAEVGELEQQRDRRKEFRRKALTGRKR